MLRATGHACMVRIDLEIDLELNLELNILDPMLLCNLTIDRRRVFTIR